MTFNSAILYELRSHHFHCAPRLAYEPWLASLIQTFEARFPELPVLAHPHTFLVWVRANTKAILAIQTTGRVIN